KGLREKYFERWVPGYVRYLADRARAPRYHGTRHILFAVTDHYEPLWGKADDARGAARVEAWRTRYPKLADKYRDADGRMPRHSFFSPGEEYRPRSLDALAELARRGYGEVEVHLHHDNDTAASLEPQLLETVERFAAHGHLSRDARGQLHWAFIHGN